MSNQDFTESIRPILFQTDIEEFLYATHGGTLFVVSFRGKFYGLTCRHVFKDFRLESLLVFSDKMAKKGTKPTPIQGMYYADKPHSGARDTDITDLCVIRFGDAIPTNFFNGSEYCIDESSIVQADTGRPLLVAGVLKDKTTIDPPNIDIGYCQLELADRGATSDPFLREAKATFDKPNFKSITGISGSPVLDFLTNKLCGMVLRGGLVEDRCTILYLDIFDIVRFLDAIESGKPSCSYLKTQSSRDASSFVKSHD